MRGEAVRAGEEVIGADTDEAIGAAGAAGAADAGAEVSAGAAGAAAC